MGEELEGFSGLDGGGEVDGGGEDANGVAGFDGAGGWGGEEAGEAGGVPGKDGHGGGVGAHGGGVDPGDGLLDSVVVEEVAGFEVVGAIEEEVGAGEKGVDVCGDEVGDDRFDLDGGVEEGDLAACGFGFGECGFCIGFVKEDLALEVGGFDEVAIDEGEMADSGAGEERGGGGAGGSDADDRDAGTGEQGLSGGADAWEEDLAGVAFVGGDGRHEAVELSIGSAVGLCPISHPIAMRLKKDGAPD